MGPIAHGVKLIHPTFSIVSFVFGPSTHFFYSFLSHAQNGWLISIGVRVG